MWASIGKVDVVGIAQGKIVPSGRVKVVQPLESGIVRAIHVQEGVRVRAGDVLVELDSTKAQADLVRLKFERKQVESDLHRLRELLRRIVAKNGARDAPRLPPQLAARTEQAFLSFTSRRNALLDEIARHDAEARTMRAQIELINQTVPLIAERAAAVKQLEEQALAPRAKWLELEEQRVEQVQQREIFIAEQVVIAASRDSAVQRLATLRAETERTWRAELAAATTQSAVYTQEINKAQRRLEEATLRAPVAGIVQQLSTNTVGGVVASAEQLMLIVPDEGALTIEAWVLNKDVGFIERGQAAEIKVEAFPFTKYGTIKGTLETVSRDAVSNDALGLVYLAQVAMEKTSIRVRDKLVNLTPGMAVTVEVNMGTRRVVEFLLTPLLRYRDEGLTER